MSFRIHAFAILLTIAASACSATAAESRSGTLVLDPSRTLVEFRLAGALHTTHGNFKLERGTISADPATGEASGVVVIDAKSGDSGIGARDRRMKEEVLEAQKYPEIIFEPRRVTGRLEKDQFQAVLQGILKVHGTDHPITMEIQGQFEGSSLIAKSHFSVPYVEWGMTDPSILFLTVAKQVDIDIATSGTVVWTIAQAQSRRN
ncbi:MAG TPA: YceI family protein [Patescibacteria group bacterium]|nr:YceI family protein [Patescibacteria group bacterium]